MKTVTITSQGQITIPAAIRRAWGITGSQELNVSFDQKTQRMTVERPLSIDEALAVFDAIPRKNVTPLINVHEFYEVERTKEIMQRTRESL